MDSPEVPGKVVILAEDVTDFKVLRYTEEYLSKLGVPFENVIIHRGELPSVRARQVADLEARGTAVFIAGSGFGIDFACEVGKATTLPVLVIPIVDGPIRCIDEFLRPFFDMPPGVATFAVGRPGAINAALFAAKMIFGHDSAVWENLRQMRVELEKRVRAMKI